MKRIIDKLNGSPTLIYRSFILNQNNVYRSTNTTIANVPTLYRSFCSTTTTTAKEEKQEIIFDKNTTNTLLKDADNISSTTTLANIDDNIEIKKKNLIGLPFEELYKAMQELNLKHYTSKQIWRWIYKYYTTDINHFTDISKKSKELLDKYFFIDNGIVKQHKVSKDGTRKYLIEFDKQAQVETVFIPETQYGTLCVSSQVGCTFSCTFCHTGTQKMIRNLTSGEIVAQVLHARMDLGDNDEMKLIRNIVFMGQGEPLYNYRNLVKAIDILNDPLGLDFGKQRITISTSGVVPLIYRLASDVPKTALAISLHAPNNKLRSELVTANKQWPLEELIEACRHWSKQTRERITFEYTMLEGVNDHPEHAHQLIDILKGIPSHINLIPFNPWPGSKYKSSGREAIQTFVNILQQARVNVTIRQPRGQDIDAACGQLRTTELTKKTLLKEKEKEKECI